MQLGKFIFTQEREPGRVFIQIEDDGEAGYFNWADVPDAVKTANPALPAAVMPSVARAVAASASSRRVRAKAVSGVSAVVLAPVQ
jgi:hypothetical protein